MSVTDSDVSLKFDTIVVGGGGAGLMAALSAAQKGAKTALVEKNPRLGGTTGLSVGTICAATTRLQREAGIIDTLDSHYEDMEKFMGPLVERDNAGLRRLLVEHTPEAVAVLEEIGVTFMGPLPEPPHTKPRLHAVLPHSRSYIRHLENACRRAGVTILTGRRVTSLLREDGAVIGVETDAGTHKAERLLAGTGVVLASGDFSSADQAYKERFLSGPLLAISGINPTSTGDGQRMGEAVGAEVTNGDLAWGPEIRFTAPPRPSIVSRMPTHRLAARTLLLAMKLAPQWLLRPILLRFVTTFLAPSHKLFEEGAILVNRDGERFCDELNRPQDSIGYQREQAAWIVFDDAIAQRFTAWPYYVSTAPGVGYAYVPDYARSRPDLYSTAPDIEGLAAKIGVPAAAMRKSLEDHNASLASDEHRKPLEKGPFHAIGPAKSWIVFTEGGLRIDESFRVLDKAREPIPGLYAAGSAGQGGVILEGHGHHLGWAFTSGLLAGRNAAGTAAQHNRGSSTRSIQ